MKYGLITLSNRLIITKQHFHKIDKMALIAVAGIGGKNRNRKNRKKSIKDKIKNRLKKVGACWLNSILQLTLQFFLAMVKLNIFGLAKKLDKVRSIKAKDLYKFWNKIGGTVKNLDKAIDTGKRKGTTGQKMSGIGVVPAIAAAIAAATPIIIKIGEEKCRH